MTSLHRQKVDRPETFWELTRSICPACKRVIDAQILLRDGRVIMRKRCPEHGWFEALVFGDADLYTRIQRFNKPGTLPLKFATETRDGCPLDCRLCPEHQQHTCLALIEVHSGCALDRLAAADVRVVLVAAIERGVNEHEVGRIVEFGLRHPAVFGVNFQPAFRAQRHLDADPLSRMTIPDVLRALETQSAGLLKLDDFVPVPCCMPTCNFVTYALIDGDEVTPITRMIDVEAALDYLKNRTVPALSDELVGILERLWSSSAQVGSDSAAADVQRAGGAAATRAVDRCEACRSLLPLSAHIPRDLARHVFMVNTR